MEKRGLDYEIIAEGTHYDGKIIHDDGWVTGTNWMGLDTYIRQGCIGKLYLSPMIWTADNLLEVCE